jgi:hypothetical protein
MRARVFLLPNNVFVLFREVGEFGPALGHCQENRGALKRDARPLRACGAIGGACSTLVGGAVYDNYVVRVRRWI